MSRKIYVVDAFASKPFTGNPAGVCILDKPLENEQMQKIANEMNLAETAFITKVEGAFNLRWFTPVKEVELCGHATLSAAHILWEKFNVNKDKSLIFSTLSGDLVSSFKDGKIILDFPTIDTTEAQPPEDLFASIGSSDPVWIGKGTFDYLVEVKNENAVRVIKPDFQTMIKLDARGIIVTAKSSDPNYDIISRFFAPKAGVNEDYVTGSAHCALGVYWQKRIGKSTIRAYQASARGGELEVEVLGTRTLLKGSAITIMENTLLI